MQLALSADMQRVYYGDSVRALWFYDRASKRTLRLADAGAGDLALAPTGSAIAYTRVAVGSADQYIWMLPLDARTGGAAGTERRVSAVPGDAPSISPDGRLIAFAYDDSAGVGQGVVVAPVVEGVERVVVPIQSSGISSIRWSPDGRSLYYTVNAPVACHPEWSCLEIKRGLKQNSGSMRRVSLGGDVPTVLVPTLQNGWPGLSPDGSLLAYSDTGSLFVVADSDGRRLHAFPLPPRQTIEGWLNRSTLVLTDRGNVRRLRSYTIGDGARRLVVDDVESLIEPSPAPDGKRVSVVRCMRDQCDIGVVNVDGSVVRAIPLAERFGGGNIWSPDGRWLAYIAGAPAGERRVSAIDVATGRETTLGTLRASAATLLWTADSRSVIVSTTIGADRTRHVDIQRMAFDAPPRMLRSFVVGPTPSGGNAIDPNTAVLLRDGAVTRAALHGDSSETPVFPKSAGRISGLVTASPDMKRLAIRRARDGADDLTIIDVANADGEGRATIETPFWIYPGANSLRWVPGREQLIVLGGPLADDQHVGVYLVDVRTRSTRRIFTLSGRSVTGELAVSPDGGTVFYTSDEVASPRVYTMDLSSLRTGVRK